MTRLYNLLHLYHGMRFIILTNLQGAHAFIVSLTFHARRVLLLSDHDELLHALVLELQPNHSFLGVWDRVQAHIHSLQAHVDYHLVF